MDIAHWGMGVDDTGPVEIEAEADFPSDGLWDVHGPFRIDYVYPNGVKVIYADTRKVKHGIVFEGTDGWVHVGGGRPDAHPKSLLASKIRPDEVHLHRSTNHKADFLESIRSRSETVAPVENGHRTCSACILGYLAMQLGRKLKWDPKRERFVDDADADRWISKPMRAPWRL